MHRYFSSQTRPVELFTAFASHRKPTISACLFIQLYAHINTVYVNREYENVSVSDAS